MTMLEIEGRRLGLTNLDKVLWPEAGLTKGKLIEYYVRVAPALLPHLEGRPLTLRRFPDGVHGVSWHQNECRGEPEWFQVFETTGVGGRVLRFCVVDDLSSLVWVANQAAIELHRFSGTSESRAGRRRSSSTWTPARRRISSTPLASRCTFGSCLRTSVSRRTRRRRARSGYT